MWRLRISFDRNAVYSGLVVSAHRLDGPSAFLHLLAQDGNLLLDLSPQEIPIKAMVRVGRDRLVVVLLRRNGQQRRHEGFLDVGEAEPVRDLGDGRAQLVGELDVLVVRQLGLPEPAVPDPLREVGVREQVFPVEAAGPLGDARVEALQVVGAPDHQDAVVVLEAVNLVEEVAADLVRDDAVQILEDQVTRRRRSGLGEDQAEGVFGPGVAGWGW